MCFINQKFENKKANREKYKKITEIFNWNNWHDNIMNKFNQRKQVVLISKQFSRHENYVENKWKII